MKENYPKAYTEVLEIMNYMPKEDVNKIPKEMIEMFENKRDKSYVFNIKEIDDFTNLNILDETKAIIVNIFRDYWATPEQKKINMHFDEKGEELEELIKHLIINILKKNKKCYNNQYKKEVLKNGR